MKPYQEKYVNILASLGQLNPKQTMGGLNQDAAYSAASPCQMNKV